MYYNRKNVTVKVLNRYEKTRERGIEMSNFDNRNAEAAIIPKGTVINGNIDISGQLEMYGTVNGNITSDDRVNICGDIKGDIKAHDLYTKDSFIEGKIDCTSGVVVRENTVILGDIDADSLMVDGAIQGKLDIKGCVTLGEKAIVDSDILAKSIQVSNGAAINGKLTLCYADIDANKIFPEPPKPVKDSKPAARPRKNTTAQA